MKKGAAKKESVVKSNGSRLWRDLLGRLLCALCVAVVLVSCSKFKQQEIPFVQMPHAEEYARERYLLAMQYMTKNRFELARQQFHVAAVSAQSAELQRKAELGYKKAEAIIIGQR